jgi:signal transduction histidine kinase
MADDLSLVMTVASGLICLVLGLYVFLKGRRQVVNALFFLICIFMAIWCLGEAMTMTVTDLAAKTFWTRFQGLGEMPLIPTYLLLAHYFTSHKILQRDRSKTAVLIVALYAPWLLGLVLLYTTGTFYSSYYLIEQGQGINVVRTPFFWLLTALGFIEILAATVIYLRARSRTSVKVSRKGLLILALAPVPMLVANAVQNLEISPQVTTPQAGLLFIGIMAYGILRYGLFVDIRSITRNMLAHAVVIAGNLIIFTSLCMFYVYGLDMGFHWSTYVLFVLAGIPFMIGYHAELEWARKLIGRNIYGREFEEGRLLQELGSSIRTVSNMGELAESVAHKVRESMGLSACALMMSEDGGYRVVGYAASDKHPAGVFNDTILVNTHMLDWERAYSTYSDGERFSTYWTIGNRIYRGQCVLEFIDKGILRIYEGDGKVREITWREEEEGEVVSIPLEIHGERVGLLWFGGKLDGVRFTLAEFDFMVALSIQLSVSLLNSKLMQELLDKSARLQRLIHSTSSAQEEERIRISRELHDGLAPYFLDFIFRLDMLEAQAAGFPDLSASLDELRAKAREGLRDLRQVIGDLRPSSLDVLGLEKSLSTYLERFAAENGMAVEFSTSGDLERLDSLTEVTIFRVAQEALSNIAHHADAAKVRFMLKGDDGWVEMVVEDDGTGFSEREVRERMIMGECLGIRGMRERAELMQGDLVIDSRPGDGTKVSLSFPIRRL